MLLSEPPHPVRPGKHSNDIRAGHTDRADIQAYFSVPLFHLSFGI